MRRGELVAAIAKKTGAPWAVDGALAELVKLIVRETAAGEEVIIHGLGTFKLVEVKAKRVVTNGVARVVPARRALKFTAARHLRGLGREGGGK